MTICMQKNWIVKQWGKIYGVLAEDSELSGEQSKTQYDGSGGQVPLLKLD